MKKQVGCVDVLGKYVYTPLIGSMSTFLIYLLPKAKK